MMERHFDIELRALKEKLILMCNMVEQAIINALKSYDERNEEMAKAVIADDKKIDMLEVDVENTCMRLFALHQPQAGDLRFISAVMKINNDLERVGDLAANMSERAIDLSKIPPMDQPVNFQKLSKAAQQMLRDSIAALIKNDAELARSVCKRDNEVDDYYVEIFNELLKMMQKDENMIVRALEVIHIGKGLERIADHATNICEDVIYMVDGKVIKHHLEG